MDSINNYSYPYLIVKTNAHKASQRSASLATRANEEIEMKMQDLPVEVQVIAAQLLAERIDCATRGVEKKPVTPLAQEVRDAFIELYSQPHTFCSQRNTAQEDR